MMAIKRETSRRRRPLAAVGMLFAVLGAAALVHPRFFMPGEKNEVQVGGQKVIMETRQVFVVPRLLSACFVVAGGALIYIGLRRG